MFFLFFFNASAFSVASLQNSIWELIRSLPLFVLLLVSSIRLKNMGFYIITELQIQNMLDLILDLLVLDREKQSPHGGPDYEASSPHFPYKSRHCHYCGNRKYGCAPGSFLQWNVHGYSRSHQDSHSQTADTSDQQVNLHATGRCMIKSCNDLRITKESSSSLRS